MKTFILSCLWFLLCIFITLKCAHAGDHELVACVVGEASNQGSFGMYALASGLLNRIDLMGYDKALKGVYGCHARHVKDEPAWVWEEARLALANAKVKRLHSGSYWENIKAFGRPGWVKDMRLVYQYRDHWFYKNK